MESWAIGEKKKRTHGSLQPIRGRSRAGADQRARDPAAREEAETEIDDTTEHESWDEGIAERPSSGTMGGKLTVSAVGTTKGYLESGPGGSVMVRNSVEEDWINSCTWNVLRVFGGKD